MNTPKKIWTVQTWQGSIGRYTRKSDAQAVCKLRREADRQAGNRVDARVVEVR